MGYIMMVYVAVIIAFIPVVFTSLIIGVLALWEYNKEQK